MYKDTMEFCLKTNQLGKAMEYQNKMEAILQNPPHNPTPDDGNAAQATNEDAAQDNGLPV
jgi:hypothetical protein